MSGDELVIRVHGTPAPQGSKRHVGGGRMVEMSKGVDPWRTAVRLAVIDAAAPVIDRAVEVGIEFIIARPAGHWRRLSQCREPLLRHDARPHPSVVPDLDKLCRSTLDGLAKPRSGPVTAHLIADDAQVIALSARKRYAAWGEDSGAVITVREVTG